MTAPLTQKLVALSSEGYQVYSLFCSSDFQREELKLEEGFPQVPGAELVTFSNINGQTLGVVNAEGLHLIDLDSKSVKMTLARKGIQAVKWSPLNSMIVTCEKYCGEKNLLVWDSKTGKIKASFEWMNTIKAGVNSIVFSEDEKFVANQQAKNVISVYTDSDFSKPAHHITAQPPKSGGKELLSLATDQCRFDGFTFAPKIAGQKQLFFLAWQNGEVLSDSQDTGVVHVFDFSKVPFQPKFSITCTKAQQIQLLPQPSGKSFLIWAQNLNDSSGKSYYGEHSL